MNKTNQLIERTKETRLYDNIEITLNHPKINNILKKHGINRLYKTRWFTNLIDDDIREHNYNRRDYVVAMSYILSKKVN